MARHIALRLVTALATLLLIAAFIFACTNLRDPTSLARQELRQGTPAQLEAYVEAKGLDRPWYERFTAWTADLARGDWGRSPFTGRPVSDDVFPRLRNTLILVAIASLVAFPIALILGMRAGRRAGTAEDQAVLLSTATLAALPEFLIGFGLILAFAIWLPLLPVTSGAVGFGDPLQVAQAYVLPAIALAMIELPILIRLTRSAFRDTLAAPYMRAATLRGLSQPRLMWAVALPNAGVTLVHVYALSLIYSISSAIVIENVFGFPGIGQGVIQAYGSGDVLALQAAVFSMGVIFILLSFIADAAAAVLNPRLRSVQ